MKAARSFAYMPIKYDAEIVLSFLRKIIEKYPSERIILILDNAKIHHAKLI